MDGPEEWRSKAPPPEQADDDRFVAGFHASLNPNAPEKGEVRSEPNPNPNPNPNLSPNP